MSTAGSPVRIDALDPFKVMLKRIGARPALVLRTAPDPDQASVAFHAARQRLTRDQIAGDLLLVVQHDDEPRTLLWEPLG